MGGNKRITRGRVTGPNARITGPMVLELDWIGEDSGEGI